MKLSRQDLTDSLFDGLDRTREDSDINDVEACLHEKDITDANREQAQMSFAELYGILNNLMDFLGMEQS